jgi:hypothetical protein
MLRLMKHPYTGAPPPWRTLVRPLAVNVAIQAALAAIASFLLPSMWEIGVFTLLSCLALSALAFFQQIGRGMSSDDSTLRYVGQAAVFGVACLCAGVLASETVSHGVLSARVWSARSIGDSIVSSYRGFHAHHGRWPVSPTEVGIELTGLRDHALFGLVVNEAHVVGGSEAPSIDLKSSPLGWRGVSVSRRVDEDEWTHESD